MAYSIHKADNCNAVEVKPATGVGWILIDCVEVCVQCWSAIVNVTVLVPELAYITPVGFSAEEVEKEIAKLDETNTDVQ